MPNLGGGQNLTSLIKRGIVGGGYGPGSYYPWIYLQMAILIPIMRPICDKLRKWKSLVVFLLLSVVTEVVCSITHLPDSVYRLLCIRYIFLIWCGWLWVQEGIRFNAINIIASFVSLFAIVYFAYFNKGLEPWFYNTGWATHRWICYFWCSFLFAGLLYKFFFFFLNDKRVTKVIKMLASASYEIFLVQMAYYVIVPSSVCKICSSLNVSRMIYIALAYVVSISIGCGILEMRKVLTKNTKSCAL